MPTGEEYRFLYIFLYNKGYGWKIAEDHDERPLSSMLEEYGCDVIYLPQFNGDMVVGKKDGDLIGLATLFGIWAINLSARVPN